MPWQSSSKRQRQARIVVLYRVLRSYGFREHLYQQARRAGVIFLEYSEMKKPVVERGEKDSLRLSVAVQPEDDLVTLEADWLVLSAGIEPEPGNSVIAQLL